MRDHRFNVLQTGVCLRAQVHCSRLHGARASPFLHPMFSAYVVKLEKMYSGLVNEPSSDYHMH